MAFEVEQRKAEIGMSIRRRLVESNRALKDPFRVLEPPAVEDGHAQ